MCPQLALQAPTRGADVRDPEVRNEVVRNPETPARADMTCPREQLLEVLYAQHADALFAFVVRLVGGDRQYAEDVVQETLLRAWRSAEELDQNRPSLRPWLYTVARRIVIDAHRRRSVRPKQVDSSTLEHIPEADEIDKLLSSMAVSDALASLTAQHRAVIHEIYFRGSKVNEAAHALGIPPGTVKSRTYYAVRALRLALEERGIDGREWAA